jgi:hypothetical protein
VAVQAQLQKISGTVRRTARALGFDAGKAQCLEIQRVDERVNQPNRVVVADQIVQSFRQ